MTTFLNLIKTETNLTEAERDAILGQNFKQILGDGEAAPQ
jgi:hypothetical protein